MGPSPSIVGRQASSIHMAAGYPAGLEVGRLPTDDARMEPTTVRAEVVTTAPLTVGLGLLAEGGPRLRVGTSLGVLPGPYVDGINGAIAAFVDSWDDGERQLVEDTLTSSVVWQLHAGWRPAGGFVVSGGSQLVTLGGASTTADLVTGLTDAELPPGFEGAPLTASATLFLLGAELGWDQRVWQGLHVRAGVGWSFTVTSSTHITAQSDRILGDAVLDGLAAAGEVYLDDTFRKYAHPPTATLAVGWAFGDPTPR